METESESGSSPAAWQPLTLGGLAAFARSSHARLLVVGMLVALIGSGSLLFVFERLIVPRIEEVLPRMPPGAALEGGKLVWPDREIVVLTRGPTFSVVVDPAATFALGAMAEFHLHLLPDHFRVYSLFGHLAIHYPGRPIGLEARQSHPHWQAWGVVWRVGLAAGFVAYLWICWVGMSALALPWLYLAGIWRGAGPGIWGCLKLGVAAAFPGSLLLSGGLIMHGRGQCPMSTLAILALAHFLVFMGYVLLAPLAFDKPSPPERRGAIPARKNRKSPFDSKD